MGRNAHIAHILVIQHTELCVKFELTTNCWHNSKSGIRNTTLGIPLICVDIESSMRTGSPIVLLD